jgi:spore coat polysaccharide biosynthesis protein SpsF (cytidylyltransferase family)
MSVYFTKTGLFNCEQLIGVNKKFYRNDIRLTLDYPEDHLFFKTLINKYKFKKQNISTMEIIKIINKNPRILKINKHRIIEWKNNQSKSTKIILKKNFLK